MEGGGGGGVLSYTLEKSWKMRGSDFRAGDKQQTYSTPGRLPNIAPVHAVCAEGFRETHLDARRGAEPGRGYANNYTSVSQVGDLPSYQINF